MPHVRTRSEREAQGQVEGYSVDPGRQWRCKASPTPRAATVPNCIRQGGSLGCGLLCGCPMLGCRPISEPGSDVLPTPECRPATGGDDSPVVTKRRLAVAFSLAVVTAASLAAFVLP